ncbi:hypothetical protein D5R93_11670 [Actinomyces lilanjuaniae]|uniref:Uncharacterized protein n=1 Tax=Actinomyces lilanjuaniae TaxID=2321394 RepID=A0ABM6Z570_9ACTO|nr:hypothetical protein [Actinomyces lilanjuaniae]AYD90494.1 hypothetical protein D5R93_11670 [Actinomyces lilanjuaniae]
MAVSESDEDRKEDLEALKETVESKNVYLGFVESVGGPSTSPGDYRARKINADDTWSGPLADDKADAVREGVQGLAEVFTGLADDIQAAIDGLS